MSQKERPRYMTAQMKEDVEYDEEHLAAAKQLGIDTVSWGACQEAGWSPRGFP